VGAGGGNDSLTTTNNIQSSDFFLLIDGNDFPPYLEFNSVSGEMCAIPHETIPGGDNSYLAIASASILAKTARDDYILELCDKYPLLGERYGLDKNMGYGTKTHLEGIEKYGITELHRKTYGRCKDKEVVMDCFF
jgi:ribonuclease HII